MPAHGNLTIVQGEPDLPDLPTFSTTPALEAPSFELF
jgi:hypothetical protein